MFLAALDLRCFARAFSWGEQGLLFATVLGLLLVVAPLVEHGLQELSMWAQSLQFAGSIVVALGLNCSEACGIVPGQGSNLCLLHWQVGSYSLAPPWRSEKGPFESKISDLYFNPSHCKYQYDLKG